MRVGGSLFIIHYHNLNIEMARKRNPGLRGRIKKRWAGQKLPPAWTWRVFQTTGREKVRFFSAKIHEKQPGSHECSFLTSLPHLCVVFTHSCNVHDLFLLVFVTQVC